MRARMHSFDHLQPWDNICCLDLLECDMHFRTTQPT